MIPSRNFEDLNQDEVIKDFEESGKISGDRTTGNILFEGQRTGSPGSQKNSKRGRWAESQMPSKGR